MEKRNPNVIAEASKRLQAALAQSRSDQSGKQDRTGLAASLIETIQHENLHPLEEAVFIQHLIDECKMTFQEAAEAVGRSSSSVIRLLQLLTLSHQVQTMLMEGNLEMGDISALLALEGEKQIAVANEFALGRLTIREAKALAQEGHGFVSLSPLLTKVVDDIEALSSGDSYVTGIATGFKDLDSMTSGLQPGDLIIVAGRPCMGKTAYAINIAENIALDANKPVAIFSMEMGGAQLAKRMIGSVGHINQHALRTGKLESDDWTRMMHALSRLKDAPIFIDETPGLNPLELRSRARRLHQQNDGLGLIVIDYLQLISSAPGKAGENRATEISEILRSLKELAQELHVPVIVVSQLHRHLENRKSKRPIMSDLREFGAIDRYADLILFIYRDEVYNPDSAYKDEAEIIIGRQRNGPIGSILLTFCGEYTRFENHVCGQVRG